MKDKDLGKTSTGIQPNVAALLSYVCGFVTGIIFYLIEKENKFVRFHAMQSILTFGLLTILMFIPFIGWILAPFIGILSTVLWVFLMVKAYQGDKLMLPVLGKIAEKNA